MPNQTTFIPKTPVARPSFKKAGFGWFGGLSAAFFALSLLFVLGLFFYRGFIADKVAVLSAELEKVESEFEPPLILELQRTSKALSAAQALLNGHVALSQLFDFLEANTLGDVRFTNFSYSGGVVSMNGVARSYTAMAEQSLIFEQSRLIKGVAFSNFSLASGGLVNFSVNFIPEPELVSYQPTETGQISSN